MIQRIGDLIEVPPVRTVIRLEDGATQPEAIARTFVFTSEVAGHLAVLSDALLRERGQGYFLQGDFGSGKSHFLSCLAAWLSQAPGTEVLAERHPGLRRLAESGRRFFVVPVSLVNFRATTPLEQILVQAVELGLQQGGEAVTLAPLSVFIGHLQELVREPGVARAFADIGSLATQEVPAWIRANPREAYTAGVRLIRHLGLPSPEVLVEDRHETFRRVLQAVRSRGFAGLVILFDELSEFLRSKPDARRLNEDARTLQFLGELSSSEPVWIVGAVQESLERTGDIAQVTFRKIKDRFPVKLGLTTLHIRDLISQRLVRHKPGADEAIRKLYEDFRRQFRAFSWGFDEFRDAYPVHPATLVLLEGLGDLFSEHRGIVDFVCAQVGGDRDRHIPGILDRRASELLAPDAIYDHFAGRLMEVSAFNAYPRHIVPHLDEVIAARLEDNADRALARRLVRILVLYQIHPTADVPSARALTELAGCMLGRQDPNLSVQFISETILDPVVAGSRFLVKRPASGPDRLDAVYRIVTEEDPSKTLEARLSHAAAGLAADDSRLLGEVLAELPASVSWPGPDLWENGCERAITWRNTSRRALVAFCRPGEEPLLAERLRRLLAAGAVDFGLVLGAGDVEFACEHTAFWAIPAAGDDALRQYLAAKLVAAELRPSNPAEAPLIDLAAERVRALAPAAAQAAQKALYGGEFADSALRLDGAARQLRRFDRLVEAAGEHLLEQRYPRFAKVAPRGLPPSPRLYQRIVEELVGPGSMSLHAAREKRLTEAIEGLAVPLGLVDLRSGSYVFSPDLQGNPLLASLFARLSPSSPTPLADVLAELKTGPFGLPHDTAAFLLLALACGGIVSLLSRGRALPLEFLHLGSVDTAEAVALGELLSEPDRELLVSQCAFLAPTGGWEGFGLRQQREAWQGALKFKEKTARMLEETEARIGAVAGYSAFEALDWPSLKRLVRSARLVVDEIKVSYSAREGLERFLAAWRQSGLEADDAERLRQLHRFLVRDAEQVIFVGHYARHPAVEAAAGAEPELEASRRGVLALLGSPDLITSPEAVAHLSTAFAGLREAYGQLYAAAHGAFHRPVKEPELPRQAKRALKALKSLASIDLLDRPPGLDALLKEAEPPAREPCRKNVAELLLRSPLCDCGFRVGDALPSGRQTSDPGGAIDLALSDYGEILRRPEVREGLDARAYALGDLDPDAAERLRRLSAGVREASAATLLDLLDPVTVQELGSALASRVTVVHRQLGELFAELAGRRLPAVQVRALVDRWLAPPSTDAVFAVEGSSFAGAGEGEPTVAWWAVLREDLVGSAAGPKTAQALRSVAAALERQYPASTLRQPLESLEDRKLVEFVAGERFHSQAVREGWLLLADRVLTGQGGVAEAERPPGSPQGMDRRLENLARLQALREASFPGRLRARLALAAVFLDPWATDPLQRLAEESLAALCERAADWLALLPPLEPIPLPEGATAVVLDAVPPDVWLEAAERAPRPLAGGRTTWARLSVDPVTAASMSALFGFRGDALDELSARGILYHRAAGNEREKLAQQLPLHETAPVVAHLNLFDRGAHGGTVSLADMPERLIHLLERELEPLRRACRKADRTLVLTTDHGLTFSRRGLTHGAGGAFEEAIFRCEWQPGQ